MFTEQERLIFSYDVTTKQGTVTKHADPLAVRRTLLRESTGQFFYWVEGAREPDEFMSGETPRSAEDDMRLTAALMSAQNSQEQVVTCVRTAFGLPAIDPETGEGVAESECWRVLNEYNEWNEKKRSKVEP